jgi:hypothetical protein|tara:strand:+ start:110 stop:346 length:237 start_codon:yes stop_codon:yes gene_type:complete
MTVKPSRPTKVPSKKSRTKSKPAEPVAAEKETSVEEPAKMKYAQRELIGKPQLGSPITVKTVGLGNLEVITHNGRTDV